MFMRFSHFLTISLVSCIFVAWPANADDLRFAGDASGETDAFTMDGPWLLDWSARSPSRLPCNYQIWSDDGNKGLPCNFELRLFDAASGDYVGIVAQLEGEGRGYKLFESAGNYRIDIVSQNVAWELLVKPITEERAAKLKALTESGPTLEDRSVTAAREVADDTFSSWRPVDDSTLLLFAADGTTGYRVTFTPACTGLAQATALSFVSASGTGGIERFDSILLDDGTQCYFDRVIPTVFD
jgi:hypothetical protein